MPNVYTIDGLTPVVHPSAYVHPTAVLIGDVLVGPGCYIGPCASLRGDFGRLILEQGVNVQDCCVIHGFPTGDTVVEQDGHIGHGAILHCCRVRRNALVGMNAVVMDRADIGESSMVAACAFVRVGMVVPPRVLVAGAPAKVIRELPEQEIAFKAQATRIYQQLTRRCLATMTQTEALREAEPGRRRLEVPELAALMQAQADWRG